MVPALIPDAPIRHLWASFGTVCPSTDKVPRPARALGSPETIDTAAA